MHLRCGVGGKCGECCGWREKLMYVTMCARKNKARMDTVIKGGTSSFKMLGTCGERGTLNGK